MHLKHETDKAKLRVIGGRLPAEKFVGGLAVSSMEQPGKATGPNPRDSRVAKVEKKDRITVASLIGNPVFNFK